MYMCGVMGGGGVPLENWFFSGKRTMDTYTYIYMCVDNDERESRNVYTYMHNPDPCVSFIRSS
jgi:hypothetical protein